MFEYPNGFWAKTLLWLYHIDWMMLSNRAGLAILFLLCSMELFKVSNSVRDERLQKFTRRASLWVYTFYVARIIAAVVDAIIGYRIGIISSVVSYFYFGWFYRYLRRQNTRLRAPEFRSAVMIPLQNKLAQALDILEGLETEQREITGG